MRILALLLVLLSAPPALAQERQNILVMGDSIMAWNKLSGNTVARNLARELNAEILDNSVSGEPIGRGGNEGIFSQYKAGSWDWVVVNGGGNDFLRICRCGVCDPILNRLISKNGKTGVIPSELRQLRAKGHRVLYMGYLRTNGFASPVFRCSKYIDALEERVANFAASESGVFFMYNKDLVPDGNRSFHAIDRIHPSVKGSRAIAKGLADVIKQTTGTNQSVFSNGG